MLESKEATQINLLKTYISKFLNYELRHLKLCGRRYRRSSDWFFKIENIEFKAVNSVNRNLRIEFKSLAIIDFAQREIKNNKIVIWIEIIESTRVRWIKDKLNFKNLLKSVKFRKRCLRNAYKIRLTSWRIKQFKTNRKKPGWKNKKRYSRFRIKLGWIKTKVLEGIETAEEKQIRYLFRKRSNGIAS